MPDFPTYTDPTLADAQSSADYQAGVGEIDAQAGLNQKTYAQTRQDLINSYQSTLDNLNYGLKQAGLQARGQYAGRNLYNASGSLSGTGELVGTELTQPITSQITNAQTAHESNLQKLALQEQQGNLDTQTAKQTLLKNVLGNLQTSAKQKYNANVDSYQAAIKAKEDEARAAAEAAKLPGGAIDVLKVIQDQQAKGRTLLYQKDLAGAVKQYGNDSIIKIGNQKFLLSADERLSLAQAKKDLAKPTGVKPPTPPSQQRSNVYDKSGKQIGYALFNPKSGQTTYQSISGNMSIDPNKIWSVGSANVQASPETYNDFQETLSANPDATLADLQAAFPELSLSDIKSLGGF